MNTSHEESTYALLVREEEKGRTILGTLLYVVLFLSVIVSVWQFVHQRISISAPGLQCVTCQTEDALASSRI